MINDVFIGTRGPHKARILIVGEAYGAMEERFQKPFMGESGNELKNMLKEAGIDPEECLYTNLINVRPPDNNMKHFLLRTLEAKDEKCAAFRGIYPQLSLREAYARLHALIKEAGPSIIIACGSWALWAVTDVYDIRDGNKKERTAGYKLASGIDRRRGSMERTSPELGSIPVLPTYHPAAILRMWSWRATAVSDLRRVREYLAAAPNERKWGRVTTLRRWIKPDASLVEAWCEGFFQNKTRELTLDLETYAGKIHLMGLSVPGKARIVIPFMDVSKSGTKPHYDTYSWRRIYRAIRHLLTHPDVRLVGQNLLFDAQYLYNEFAYIPRIGFDTMVAQHLLWPAFRRGLDYMASIYCDTYTYWKEDRKHSLDTEDLDLASNYNAHDLDYTEEVAEELKRQLTDEKMWHLFSDRMELVEVILHMMIRGVPVNGATKRKQTVAMLMTMMDLTNWMEGAIPNYLKPVGKKGSKPWYASDTKLRQLFYETLELEPIYSRDTGEPSLNRDALKRLGFRYPEFKPLFGAITLYRSARTFAGTFLNAELDQDGHWRCSYTITTETGRLASSENVYDRGGNLANIPRDRDPLTFYNAIEKLS